MRAALALPLALSLGVALALPYSSASAQSAKPSYKQLDLKGREKSYWKRRARSIEQRVAEARELYEAAHAAYLDGRQRRRARGEKKAELAAQLEAARAELEVAELDLAALPEEARKAGAPPGWIRLE